MIKLEVSDRDNRRVILREQMWTTMRLLWEEHCESKGKIGILDNVEKGAGD